MTKRKNRKLTKTMISKITDRHILLCRECLLTEMIVSGDVSAIVCPSCVQKKVAPPPDYKKEKSDKPKGWHFKSYFEQNGVVYSKGKVVTDPTKIESLRTATTSPKAKVPAKKKVVAKESVKKGKKTSSKRGTKHARSAK